MIKILKPLCVFFAIVAFFILLHMVLTADVVDSHLSEKLLKNNDVREALIYTEHHNDEYELYENNKPCICFYEDKLYMVVDEKPIDITPEGINISYFAGYTDFNETIKYKKNCLVSNDGKYIAYVLYFKSVPYLYYLDIQNEKSFCIAEKIDSFDIIENDGRDELTLVYATGYDQYNKLYAFSSSYTITGDNTEIGGEYTLLSENISVAGVFEAYGKLVYLARDGLLYSYEATNGRKEHISDSVENVYFPQDKIYNYDDYYENFTVCASIEGNDYILNGDSKIKIEQGYYNIIPKYTFLLGDGSKCYYSENNKRIVMCSNGDDKVLYNELGNIYEIFDYYPSNGDSKGSFIAASEDCLYLLGDDGKSAEVLMDLPSKYCGRSQMLSKHFRVHRVSEDVFFVNKLASGSLILNSDNQESWLTVAESYIYELVSVKRTDDGFVAETLDVPHTRYMSIPVAVSVEGTDNKNLLYVSYFDDKSVKAVSVLGENGSVKKADVLVSASLAKGQCDIKVLPCKTGTYFLKTTASGDKDFLYLPPDDLSFQVITDKNGVFTENYDDFSVAVSFGTLVIF